MLAFFRTGLIAITFFSVSLYASNNISWQPFDEGLKSAKEKNKYIFLDFYADWCQTCKRFDKTTLANASVKNELDKNFISIKVDTESKQFVHWNNTKMTIQELSRQLQVDALPTLIYLSPDYEVIGSFTSYADNNLFMNLLTYISSGARSDNKSFEDYLKNK